MRHYWALMVITGQSCITSAHSWITTGIHWSLLGTHKSLLDHYYPLLITIVLAITTALFKVEQGGNLGGQRSAKP